MSKIALGKWLLMCFFIGSLIYPSYAQIAEKREVSKQGFTTIVPNHGQWNKAFFSKAKLGFGTLFNDEKGYKILLWNNNQAHELMEDWHLHHGLTQKHIIDYTALSFKFINSSKKSKVRYSAPSSWQSSYYLGNDSSKWKTKVQPYYESVRRNIYPKIHFKQSTLGDYVKTEWHIAPNADPSQIQVEITGAQQLGISETGHLLIQTSVGDLLEKAPVAWQTINSKRVYVKVRYTLNGTILSYQLGEYNNKYPLIIDPVLVFSTYSGSVSDNFGFTATYDSKGHLYAGGISNDIGGTYPTTTGAFQDTFSGGEQTPPVGLRSDIAISKYSPDGTQLLYATYLGGNKNDYPHSLVVNSDDQLYILGTTLSNTFPTINAFDSTHNGRTDILLAHFTEDCSQLLQSTYFGGSSDDGLNDGALIYNYADDFRGDILTDSFKNIYVATCSRSRNIPTTDSASYLNSQGNLDALIFSFDKDLSKLRFSTYYGGGDNDAAYSVKLNSLGELYVGGGTISGNFPTTLGAYNEIRLGGSADGFVLRLDTVFGRVEKSTIYGSSSYEQVHFIDIDLRDRVYVAGQTEGSLTRTSGTYGKDNTSQFIAALDKDLSKLEFQTTFGNRTNNPELSPTAFLVDNCFNIYFSGWGSDIGAGHRGTTSGLETKDANWPNTDGNDFYLIVFNKEAKGLIYASFIGGTNSEDHVDGGTSRFDKNGIVYQSVCASCPPPGTSQLSDFPTTSGSVFPSNPSIRCSNASFKLDFQITYVTEAKFILPQQICRNSIVKPINTGQGTTFKWDFGDGTIYNTREATHQYEENGKYTITLFAVDSLSCNLADTFQQEIEILESPTAGFETDYKPCEPGNIKFTVIEYPNTSQRWFFGNGDSSNNPPSIYRYEDDGQYKVTQITKLANGCADTFTQTVNLSSTPGGTIQLYNVFTPNSDPFNNCWKPENVIEDCEEVETKIYNRYGTLVFNSKNDGNCWNGKLNNTDKNVAEGTYYYVLLIKRKDEKEKKEIYGVINLLR